MTRVAWSLFAICLIGAATPARGEDKKPQPIEFRATYQRIRSALSEVEAEPVTLFVELRKAWIAGHVKKRVKGAFSRVKLLDREKYWVVKAKGEPATALEPDAWSGTVKNVAKLYIDLNKMFRPYASVHFSVQTLYSHWRARNRPKPIGILPSEEALQEVERAIRELEIAGLRVPYALRSSRSRLEDAVTDERRAAEKRQREEYEKRWKAARPKLDADFKRIDAEHGAFKARLAGAIEGLRRMIYAAQRVEEDRLRELAKAASDEPATRAGLEKLLKQMAAGRKETVANRSSRYAHYGSLLRQKWLVHRGKLIKGIKAAAGKQ